MSEFQKIAIGLLGMSHPEIHRYRNVSSESTTPTDAAPHFEVTRGSKPTRATAALRGLQFGLAALLAGARSIPLGDNGRITRELGEYGQYLRGC